MTKCISVIIPHYEDLDRLNTCLSQLSRQTLPSDRFEIVVADNASPCGEDVVRAVIRSRARLVVCTERGAGPTRNAGLAAAVHPLLAFTDSDCIPDKGWLAAGMSALSTASIVGGQMKVSARSPGDRSGAEAFETVFAFDNRKYVKEQSFSVTANLFAHRRVFNAVGGFRTHVSEDVEWCRRAVAAGFKIIYADGAIVTHPARANWHELRQKWERLEQEGLALAMERPGGRWRWLVRSWALPASVPIHASRILAAPSLANGRERLRAVATLSRLRWWRFRNAQRLFWKTTWRM